MDSQLLTVLILAVIQGVTEFLPVSSDGHLVVAAMLLSKSGDPAELKIGSLTIVLHAGTLASIIVFYWSRLWNLLGEDRRVLPLLLVGSIPAAIVGVSIKLYAEDILESPLWAGLGLVATGLTLLLATRFEQGERDYKELSYLDSLWIGIAQSLAILPGVSRSGSTITTGMGLGLTPQSAATFSFLLAVPAIGGACLIECVKEWKARSEPPAATAASDIPTASSNVAAKQSIPLVYLALGAGLSFVVGLAALWALTQLLESGKFAWFAAWCIPLGIGVVIWTLTRPAVVS